LGKQELKKGKFGKTRTKEGGNLGKQELKKAKFGETRTKEGEIWENKN